MPARKATNPKVKDAPRVGLALAGGDRNAKPTRSALRSDKSSRTDRSPAKPLARRSASQFNRHRIGLALAGGGPLGAVYELGALAALAEALDGIDFNSLHAYVGVSSGGFIAAGLANGMKPDAMLRMFIDSDSAEEPFDPAVLMQPAFGEYAKRAASLPPLLAKSVWHYLSNPVGKGFFESFQRLSHAIPVGLFNNRRIGQFLERMFAQPGRSNDFRKLKHRLVVVATDLDSGATVEFGAPGFDHVPISQAVLASAALPGLFPPVEIGGRHYVDGALKKTMHASCAFKAGAGLVLGINPLVPFDAELPGRAGRRDHLTGTRDHLARRRDLLVAGGLPVVLSQTFRAIIHSRMEASLANYAMEYKDVDMVLFQPDRNDTEMFFTNIFSYSSRRRLCEHAYRKTLRELWQRRHELAPVFARHGIRIRLEKLRDAAQVTPRRAAKPQPARGAMHAAADLNECLDDLERWMREARAV